MTYIIEASRRGSKRAAERVADALMELDGVLCPDVTPTAAQAYRVLHTDDGYVVAIEDPTLDLERVNECE